MHYTAVLGATLHKEDIGTEWWRSGKNVLVFWQQANQVKTTIKKGWFSDLEILEIHQKINIELDSNIVPDTLKINKHKHPKRNEPPTSEIEKVAQSNNVQPNNPEQTLTQEQKELNLYSLTEIKNGKNYLTITKKHRMEKS